MITYSFTFDQDIDEIDLRQIKDGREMIMDQSVRATHDQVVDLEAYIASIMNDIKNLDR